MARLQITDTVGNPVKRPSLAAIGRVLDAPVNLTGAGPPDYAMVYCEDQAVCLVRSGRHSESAHYSLTEGEECLDGPATRRELLIRLFLAICRADDRTAGDVAQLRAKAARPVWIQKTFW